MWYGHWKLGMEQWEGQGTKGSEGGAQEWGQQSCFPITQQGKYWLKQSMVYIEEQMKQYEIIST